MEMHTYLGRQFSDAENEAGKADYEAEVASRPTYPDGAPRRTWEQLGEFEKASWCVSHMVNR